MLTLGNNDHYASYQFKLPAAAGVSAKTVYREILDNNAGRMDSVALVFLGKEITYRQLFDQADRVADILASYGVRKGDIIPRAASTELPKRFRCCWHAAKWASAL